LLLTGLFLNSSIPHPWDEHRSEESNYFIFKVNFYAYLFLIMSMAMNIPQHEQYCAFYVKAIHFCDFFDQGILFINQSCPGPKSMPGRPDVIVWANPDPITLPGINEAHDHSSLNGHARW
jgi:hypothetical protein